MDDFISFLQTIKKDTRTRIGKLGIQNDEELFAWAAKVPDSVLIDLGFSEDQLEAIKKTDIYVKSASTDFKSRQMGYLTNSDSDDEYADQKSENENQDVSKKNKKDSTDSSDSIEYKEEPKDSEKSSSPNEKPKQNKEPGHNNTEDDQSAV